MLLSNYNRWLTFTKDFTHPDPTVPGAYQVGQIGKQSLEQFVRGERFFVCKTMPLVCTIETHSVIHSEIHAKSVQNVKGQMQSQKWKNFEEKKLQYDFPKMRGVKGRLELLRKFIRFGDGIRP